MYVLLLHGRPLAVSELRERLVESMASPRFRAIDQAAMEIVADVEVLT